MTIHKTRCLCKNPTLPDSTLNILIQHILYVLFFFLICTFAKKPLTLHGACKILKDFLPNLLYTMVLIHHINIQRYSWVTAIREHTSVATQPRLCLAHCTNALPWDGNVRSSSTNFFWEFGKVPLREGKKKIPWKSKWCWPSQDTFTPCYLAA